VASVEPLVDPQQECSADEFRSVARAELAHGLRAMAFERAGTDAHAQRPLLVGITLADELKDLAFALGQGPLAARGGERSALRAAGFGAPSAGLFDLSPRARRQCRFVGNADLLDQSADPLGLRMYR